MEEPKRHLDNKATLGCGTLILIALIVLIFGNVGGEDMENEMRSMGREIRMLKMSVQTQATEIRRLKDSVDRLGRQIDALQRQPDDPGPEQTDQPDGGH